MSEESAEAAAQAAENEADKQAAAEAQAEKDAIDVSGTVPVEELLKAIKPTKAQKAKFDALIDNAQRDTSDDPIGVIAKLGAIQHEVGDVEKTGEVNFGKTKYSHMQEHGLIGVLRPLWRRYNLTVLLDCAGVAREANHLFGEYVLTVIDADQPKMIDGQLNPLYSISARFPNEAVDASDKASNKMHTNAMKYALQKMFMVPTDAVDDVEGSDEAHNTPSKATSKKANGTAKATQVKKITDLAMAEVKADNLSAEKLMAYLQATHGKDKISDLTMPQLGELEAWLNTLPA